MVTLVTRAGKGAAGGLTNAEGDANLNNLNSGKVETADKDAANGFPGLTGSFGLKLRNAAGNFINFLVNSTTAARTWTLPDKDGTVAMTSDLPVGAVPSLTLGTAAAAGVAATFVKTDATLLAFDATAPAAQGFGDAAVVGVANVAARRDHKHSMPASTKDTTAVTGILKGNSTAISAAVVRTDYAEPTTALATGILKNTTLTGAHTIAVAGTDYQAPIGTISGIVKGNGANALTAAVASSDYIGPGGYSTYGQAASTTLAASTGVGAFTAQAQGTAGTAGAAFMTFHRPSAYAIGFGIDTDSKLKFGGFSEAGVSWEIFHEKNAATTVVPKLHNAGASFLDKGNSGTTAQTLVYTAARHQKLTVTGAFTLSTSAWPASGNLGELLLELTNGAAFAITWPTINWIKSDGTATTTFASNGVTLQASGTDWVVLWTRDAGTTIYGKILR